jgi:hypothetical protein
MSNYYFAGRFSRNKELARYRDELEEVIPEAYVTSRWIDCHPDIVGGQKTSATPEQLADDPDEFWKFGKHDIEDLDCSETIVSFTDTIGGGKGGRHFEHGYAIATEKRIVLIGPRENIFHCHPYTEVFPTWKTFLENEREKHG